MLTLGPLFFVNTALGDTDHVIIAAFVLALAGATLIMLRNLNAQTVRLLLTNEENLALIKTVRQFNADLAAANLRLEEMATTDELTGIGNRRLFDDVLSQEVLRVRSDTNELSVLMLDVDVFKGFNDLYGHQAGDRCLRRVAETLSATLPHGADVLARYGGEEFAAILPQTGASAAAKLALAERMRADVEALAIPSVAGGTSTITVA